MSVETTPNKITNAEHPTTRNQRFETRNRLGDAVTPGKNTIE